MLQLQPTNLRRMPCAFGAGAKRPLRVGLVPRTPRRTARDQSVCRCSLQHGSPAHLLQRVREGALQAGLPLLASLLLACGPAVAGETLQGVARAVDGDTLEVAGTRIRLYGVDAPETKQSCEKGGKEYSCGITAKEALVAKIGQAPVVCDVKNKDLYGRSVAACAVAGGRGGDLGAFMVENGYAVAYRQYSKEYIPLEEKARAAHVGIWAGSFEEPAQWRKEHPRNGSGAAAGASQQKLLPAPKPVLAALPAPSQEKLKKLPPNPACAIKGNINAKGQKIYHVPGGRSYDATDIELNQGERWFCSEKEAQDAGWRAAKN